MGRMRKVLRFDFVDWIEYERAMTRHIDNNSEYNPKIGDIIIFNNRHYEIVDQPQINNHLKVMKIIVKRLVLVDIKTR